MKLCIAKISYRFTCFRLHGSRCFFVLTITLFHDRSFLDGPTVGPKSVLSGEETVGKKASPKAPSAEKKRIRRPKEDILGALIEKFHLSEEEERTAESLSQQHKKGVLVLAAQLKGRESIAGEADRIAKERGIPVMLAKEFLKIKKILGDDAANRYLSAAS